MNDRLEGFLAALGSLTREWGVEIGGCGECGSPWLYCRTENRDLGWHLAYRDNQYVLLQGAADDPNDN